MKFAKDSVGKLLFQRKNWEREYDLAQMRKAVSVRKINLPNPLEYEGNNLCDLYKRDKFQAKYKINDLQDICKHFDLPVSSPQNRKATYISAISALLLRGSCSEKEHKAQSKY